MLQLREIRKSYTVADFTQVALDDVSIAFRDNEFVAILGPSGSGKTTLLNIIGGLDRYDSGALVIDGIDTSKYSDRDWDTYRNNRVGFVFQSYNLIPHQSVLANVELALTLSGVSKAERRKRAIAGLEEVGLGDHINKKPSQLSGGQMQRVAIARALINDPEILLADEPTGALDSTTSVQIMGLLKQIADDRLVVMVTHNPELADQYATRTVDLRDGHVIADSDPFDPLKERQSAKAPKRTSMSFWTAIALSFNNLMTKKGRTLMTAFAGSIGIIGIALILALANGVNHYIKGIEEDTLSVYPLSIQSQGMDLTAMLGVAQENGNQARGSSGTAEPGKVKEIEMMGKMLGSVGSNDLQALKRFLDSDGGGIDQHANLIQYSYNVTPQIFKMNDKGQARQVNPDPTFAALGMGGSPMMSAMRANTFNELMSDTTLIKQQYDVKAGHWPSKPNELLLVLTESGGLPDLMLYNMGLRDPAELDSMLEQLMNQKPVETPKSGPLSFTYDQLMNVKFKLVPGSDFFRLDPTYKVWTDQGRDQKVVNELASNGEDLVISGIVQQKPQVKAAALGTGFYYTPELTKDLIDQAAASGVVQAQLKSPTTNVLSGRTFAEEEKDPSGGFDMQKLMSIDQNKIASAFKFDESKLTIDPSILDFSAAGLPPLDIDPSKLPQLDMSQVLGDLNLDFSSVDVQGIINDAMAGVDLSGILPPDMNEQVTSLGTELAQGYIAFCSDPANDCVTDPQASFDTYMKTDQAKQIQADFQQIMTDVQGGFEGVQEKISKQIEASMTKAVQQLVTANAAKVQSQLQTVMSNYMGEAMGSIGSQMEQQLLPAIQNEVAGSIQSAMGSLADNMAGAMSIDQKAFMDAFKFNLSEDQLTQLVMTMMTNQHTSYDANMAKFGWADINKPFKIDIYPKDFQSKEQIVSILDHYNDTMREQGNEDRVITYTDFVGTLMSSITTIVNVVSYVLIAFVAISLVVSSIMIGVITYISVLERRKEIGILRSIGASKRNIRTVFNAETLIVGFVAGIIGIGVTVLLTIPANAFVQARWGISGVAVLPWQAGVVLVAISMFLTYLAGLIPSSAASRRDPVEALRSE